MIVYLIFLEAIVVVVDVVLVVNVLFFLSLLVVADPLYSVAVKRCSS